MLSKQGIRVEHWSEKCTTCIQNKHRRVAKGEHTLPHNLSLKVWRLFQFLICQQLLYFVLRIASFNGQLTSWVSALVQCRCMKTKTSPWGCLQPFSSSCLWTTLLTARLWWTFTASLLILFPAIWIGDLVSRYIARLGVFLSVHLVSIFLAVNCIKSCHKSQYVTAGFLQKQNQQGYARAEARWHAETSPSSPAREGRTVKTHN